MTRMIRRLPLKALGTDLSRGLERPVQRVRRCNMFFMDTRTVARYDGHRRLRQTTGNKLPPSPSVSEDRDETMAQRVAGTVVWIQKTGRVSMV
jgi:hypothetical protein